jgi:hypothetical protein
MSEIAICVRLSSCLFNCCSIKPPSSFSRCLTVSGPVPSRAHYMYVLTTPTISSGNCSPGPSFESHSRQWAWAARRSPVLSR